jgi:transposase
LRAWRVPRYTFYPRSERAVFPKAAIVIDRFHMMKLIHKSLNTIRLKLGVTGLKNKLFLMKKNQDLSEFEREELRELFQQSTVLEFAYNFKDDMSAIIVKVCYDTVLMWVNSSVG